MSEVEDTLYAYRNSRRTTEIKLQGSAEGIVVSCVSVFDRDTWETDTYLSHPFSIEAMRMAIDDLITTGSCRLSEGEQVLKIVKEVSRSYVFSFDGGDNYNRFEIQGLPFDPVAVSRKMSQFEI